MVPNTNHRHSSLIFLIFAFRCRNLHYTNRRWRLSSSLEGKDNFCLIHVSLIPVLGVVGEQKTKPTQHSVRELRALGLTPHLLACHSA
ncbi:hypothetical protein ERO13_D02G155532v2 [Gossypium hirsutum]|uniref:CTP synthase N-terminal domain-containing protein n=1 Tax=Gossypium darwinii TaxID=34276 RepID=A0A5D2DFM7_GOSDA|nr:hypothetical protein ERO13_D02G155532v2 [Gossypium hirsutum]TYG80144.1 hypothetical protein ES288_D02G193300v1 [Gossypium darwinii]